MAGVGSLLKEKGSDPGWVDGIGALSDGKGSDPAPRTEKRPLSRAFLYFFSSAAAGVNSVRQSTRICSPVLRQTKVRQWRLPSWLSFTATA